MNSHQARQSSLAAGVVAVICIAALRLWPLLASLGTHYVDLQALFGPAATMIPIPDMRLNSWILAWVTRALMSDPLHVFQANTFYPATDSLAGSEHMIGVALQLLPVRLFSDNAVLLHQAAICLSFVLLALTTFALIVWLTRSPWAALVGAVLSMWMPWRLGESVHVQLEGVQWFPLVWLLVARHFEGTARRRASLALAAVLAIQLLSSFYLAYFLSFTLLVLAVVLAATRQGSKKIQWRPLVLAAVPGYVLLGLSSIPYLDRNAVGGLNPEVRLPNWIAPARVWSSLAPPSGFVAATNPATGYFIPAAVFVLAILGVVLALVRGRQHLDNRPELAARQRRLALALVAMCVGSFVLAIGYSVQIDGHQIAMPAGWAAQLVPGFDRLRGPIRWLIVALVAVPVLAALGMNALEEVLVGNMNKPASSYSRLALRAGLLTILVVNTPTATIPVADAYGPITLDRPAYAALAKMPAGPVLEIPWRVGSAAQFPSESRYTLASTLHWRPLLNGYTGYRPATYDFLKYATLGLPATPALERLKALADLHWIVVHLDLLTEYQWSRWRVAEDAGTLRRTYADRHSVIYEVQGWQYGGRWLHAMTASEPPATTLMGHPRTPLVLAQGAGGITARVYPTLLAGLSEIVHIAITNNSHATWAGFDPHPEGCVALRFVFEPKSPGARRSVEVLPVTEDVAPYASATVPVVLDMPKHTGAYLLRIELVQHIDGQLTLLPVTPFEKMVTVSNEVARAKGARPS